MKRHALTVGFFGFLIALLVVEPWKWDWGRLWRRPPPAAREGPPVFLESILAFTDNLEGFDGKKAREDDESDDLLRIGRDALRADPANVRAHLHLAVSYKSKNDFRRALQHGERAAAIQPDVSDPHYFLGDAYFELALLDMVVRGLYEQNARGLLLFSPDDTTKAIFREAMKHCTTALECKKNLDRLLPSGGRVVYSNPSRARARLERAAQYSSDVPEKLIFMEDQAKAGIWLMAVNRQPAKQQTARQATSRMLDFVARLTRGGSTGVPTAVPRDTPLPRTGEVVHWLDRVYPRQLSLIEASGHPHKERLRAALDLGWLQWAWIFCTAHSAGADRDPGKARQLNLWHGAKVLTAATTLGIALDPVAVQALKSSAAGDEQWKAVSGQIDHHLNEVEKDVVVSRVLRLTFCRVTFLTSLGVLPPRKWAEQRKALERLAASFTRLGTSEMLSPERLKALEDIHTDLLAAGGRGDGSRIDQALFRLEQWCEALLQQILRSSP